MQGAGQVYSGMQAKSQGKYESAMAKRNAAMEVEAAHESFEAGKDERRDFWRKVGGIKGQQVASMAANGIDLGFGTAELVQRDTQEMSYEDAKNLHRNIEQRTRGHHINASNFVAEGKAAKARGKGAMVSGLIGGAASVLGGVSQAAGMKAKMGT
jgi:hypothetical protein